jgi:hypothetical protein
MLLKPKEKTEIKQKKILVSLTPGQYEQFINKIGGLVSPPEAIRQLIENFVKKG